MGPTIGLLLQSTFIIQLFASPRWGKWADASGRKKVFVLCQWLSALAMLIYGFADVIWLLFVSRIIAGFGGANVSVAQAMAAAQAGDDRKKQVMGWMSGILSAGMIFGPGLGGLIGAEYGAMGLGATGAIISFVGGILVIFFVPSDAHASSPVSEDSGEKGKWFELRFFRSYPGLKPLFWIAVSASFALATLEGTFGRLIKAWLGYDERHFGIIFSYEAVLGVLVSIFALGWLGKKMCDTTLIKVGYICQGVGLGLNPLAAALVPIAPGMVWLMIASTIYAVGSGVVSPTLSALASSMAPKEVQGELFGTMQSARTVGFIIGPILGGFLFDIWPAAPYILATVVCFAVAFMLPQVCEGHPHHDPKDSALA